MLDFLPEYIKNALSHHNAKYLYEIRLREEKPISVLYNGRYSFLGECTLTNHVDKALICTSQDIADCVYRAGNYSVYSVEEQIKKGFITTEKGVRIGLAGEYVFERGQALAMRNFNGICIRVPHEVVGCGQAFFDICMSDRIQNVLLMSSPGLGKTTILRDVARIIGEKQRKNILICDERGEISLGNTGITSDILKFSDKKTAFEAGIRAMRPDIIITDELNKEDCQAVERAKNAGICVIASAHFSDIAHVKEPFLPLFDKYVLLNECCIGKIAHIYDKDGRETAHDD